VVRRGVVKGRAWGVNGREVKGRMVEGSHFGLIHLRVGLRKESDVT